MHATTTNIDRSTRTAREVAELQRDSFEALADNLASAQRRSMGLAKGGLTFMRLQEENARAAQEWVAGALKLLQLQQRNAEFLQGWTSDAAEALRQQSEHNVQTAEAFVRSASKQQESLRSLGQSWMGTYREFFSPFAYFQEGVKATQSAARQGLAASEEVARQGLRVAQEATEHSDEVLEQGERATRKAEQRAVVYGALKSTDYEKLNVEEVSRRLEGLSKEELEALREYEKDHKNRESLLERIESKIRAIS